MALGPSTLNMWDRLIEEELRQVNQNSWTRITDHSKEEGKNISEPDILERQDGIRGHPIRELFPNSHRVVSISSRHRELCYSPSPRFTSSPGLKTHVIGAQPAL